MLSERGDDLTSGVVTFSRSGKLLVATAKNAQTLSSWSVEQVDSVWTLRPRGVLSGQGAIWNVAVSHDDALIANTSYAQTSKCSAAVISDVETGTEISRTAKEGSWHVAFTPRGTEIAVDGSATLTFYGCRACERFDSGQV